MLVWRPPGDAVHAYIFKGPSGADFNAEPPPTGPDRLGWGATTGYSVTTWAAQQMNTLGAFNTQEAATYTEHSPPGEAQVNPGTDTVNTTGRMIAYVGKRQFAVQAPDFLAAKWRTTHSSITAYMTASSLNNQGSVHAAQFPVGFKELECTQVDLPTALSGNIIAAPQTSGTWTPLNPVEFSDDVVRPAVRKVVTSVPFDESTMFLQSPKVYAGPARDGVYIPTHLSSKRKFVDNSDFASVISVPIPLHQGGAAVNDGNAVLNSAKFFTSPAVTFLGDPDIPDPDFAATPVLPVWPVNRVLTGHPDGSTSYSIAPCTNAIFQGLTSPIGVFNTAMDDGSQSVIIFRGLDKDASVTFKSVIGLEIVPTTLSPLLSMVKSPPHCDMAAMKLYKLVSERSRDVHPASQNNFGSILNDITKIVDVVAPVASALLPEFAPAILGGTAALNAGNMAVQAVRRPRPQAKKPAAKTAQRR